MVEVLGGHVLLNYIQLSTKSGKFLSVHLLRLANFIMREKKTSQSCSLLTVGRSVESLLSYRRSPFRNKRQLGRCLILCGVIEGLDISKKTICHEHKLDKGI